MSTTEVKRARPQLNIYTVLLVVAALMAIFGTAVIAKINMDATGAGSPFDAVPSTGGR
ncbi:MAG: hypothetical protein JNK53_09055 [Phycisphaerae bacterium]|nr:hypothetical protein [Phycisphaerae bacterium]